MIRYLRDLRIIPIALIASACLLVLKTADLVLDGSQWFAGDNAPASDDGTSVIRVTPDAPQPPGAKQSWAQQMFNFPDAGGTTPAPSIAPPQPQLADRLNGDITGSVTPPPGAAASPPPGGRDTKPPAPASGTVIPTEGAPMPSGAERAILERLQQRRQELDTRARELDIRESLIKAAEKRIEARLAELKETEARIVTETQHRDEAEAARFKGLVTMYENMKPRDAAKIFDRLEIGVLLEVASKINPRQMSEILAQMSPDMAQRLTVALADKAEHTTKDSPAALPKIEGRPITP